MIVLGIKGFFSHNFSKRFLFCRLCSFILKKYMNFSILLILAIDEQEIQGSCYENGVLEPYVMHCKYT